jgi:hypothetical protein
VKLKIALKVDRDLVDGSKGLATEFATAQAKGRNRWLKLVTPSGIEPNFSDFGMINAGADLYAYHTRSIR